MGSSRRRLGVALVLDPPYAAEVDGLRRALGDPSLERLPPHITLVPPVNVRAADLGPALAVLRRAAAAVEGPLRLTLGPVSSFVPDNPVVFLAVGGDLEGLRRVRHTVFAPPMERKLSWPWVAHLTLADGIDPERVSAAVAALDRYAIVSDFDRLVLLEEQPGRIWEPLADAAFGRPARVGTGGLALEIAESRLIDPETASLVESLRTDPVGTEPPPDIPGPFRPIVLTGRRDRVPVGVACAWTDVKGGHVAVVVDDEVRGQGVGAHLLAHIETRLRRAGWPYPALTGHGPPGFYRSRSDWYDR